MVQTKKIREKLFPAMIITLALFLHGTLAIILFLIEPTYLAPEIEPTVNLYKEHTPTKTVLSQTHVKPEEEPWGLIMPSPGSPFIQAKPKETVQKHCTIQKNPEPYKKEIPSYQKAQEMRPKGNLLVDYKDNPTTPSTHSSGKANTQNTPLSFASIAQGFLQHNKQASGNVYMPGKEGGHITATQIALEQYATRLEKMIGPHLYIALREVALTPHVNAPLAIGFNVSEEGKLIDIRVTESSGDPYYDSMVITKIKESNPWGPPVPEIVRKAMARKDHALTLYPRS